MNWILAIPIEARMAVLFVLGAVLGSMANLATYQLAWHRRAISPWAVADPKAPARHWFDRVPIFGWLSLSRESPVHGRGFWIRPMAVELLAAFGLAWLYQWEVVQGGLFGPDMDRQLPAAWQGPLHALFASHVVLFWLMLVASLIDLDEKTIPDAITVPGTLLGLVLAAVAPRAVLPDWLVAGSAAGGPWPTMTIGSPDAMSGWPAGFPVIWPLVMALGCWALWCFGLLRRDWYTRHGLRRAVGLCLARLARDGSTVWIGAAAAIGGLLIAVAWWMGGMGWTSLASSLVGVAGAANLVWGVRLVGGRVLQREAMGFGDVTLLAMIGAYVGWQAAVLVFFLAPMFAVLVGLARYALCRDREIPYGPFLCLATLFVVLRWDAVWGWARGRFEPHWLVPAMLVACLVLLGVFLAIWQAIKRVLFRPE